MVLRFFAMRGEQGLERGKVDFAVANIGGNTVSIFLNKGAGAFAPEVDYAAGSPAPGADNRPGG